MISVWAVNPNIVRQHKYIKQWKRKLTSQLCSKAFATPVIHNKLVVRKHMYTYLCTAMTEGNESQPGTKLRLTSRQVGYYLVLRLLPGFKTRPCKCVATQKDIIKTSHAYMSDPVCMNHTVHTRQAIYKIAIIQFLTKALPSKQRSTSQLVTFRSLQTEYRIHQRNNGCIYSYKLT